MWYKSLGFFVANTNDFIQAIILREPSVYGHGLRMTQLYMLSSDGSRLKELPPPLSKYVKVPMNLLYTMIVLFVILYAIWVRPKMPSSRFLQNMSGGGDTVAIYVVWCL